MYCENLAFPENLKLLVGFVGYSANTKKLIRSLYEFRDKNPERYIDKMREIASVVDDLKDNLSSQNTPKILELLTKNRYLLRDMNQFSYRKLETKELSLLADVAEEYNAAGKFSGAGAGDCGIAIVPEDGDKDAILRKWQQCGIIPIDLALSCQGAHVQTGDLK